ncbi:anti-sigma-I factor RsgI family protein [Aquibacillus sediminis]|uniref:anti-sigma-I factor RsgI family protein n=1 Tax=Aquibacillus sediminis TaxID=2574734 RepID=UPI0011084E51|nr:hypothetical protein [Aquibacillus sediminis]
MKIKTYQGIVMEITNETITLLCNDGTFKNVPRSKHEMPMIGDLYTHVEKQRPSFMDAKYVSVVAVMLLAIITYAFFPFTQESEAYLYAVDINPSIEIYANEQLQVTSIQSLNEDGQKVVDAIANQKQHIDVILDEIIDISISQNYLAKDEKGMVALTVVPLHDQLEFDDRDTSQRMNQSIQTHEIDADVSVEKGTKELVDESKQKDLSVNKYQVYKRFEQDEVEVDLEELRNTSIPAFMKEVKEKQGQNKSNNANPNDKTNNGNQHGVSKDKSEPNTKSNHPSNRSNRPENRPNEKRNNQSNQQKQGPSDQSDQVKKQQNKGNQNSANREKQKHNHSNQGNVRNNQKGKSEQKNNNGNRNSNSRANQSAEKQQNEGKGGKP